MQCLGGIASLGWEFAQVRANANPLDLDGKPLGADAAHIHTHAALIDGDEEHIGED